MEPTVKYNIELIKVTLALIVYPFLPNRFDDYCPAKTNSINKRGVIVLIDR